MNRYSYNRNIDIQYVIINTLGPNQFKVHLRYLVKCLEIKSFKLDIFLWNTNLSKKDSKNWIYYINKTYFDNFNGKKKCEKNTSNIEDVYALKHPPLLWTSAQMEEIVREDKRKD